MWESEYHRNKAVDTRDLRDEYESQKSEMEDQKKELEDALEEAIQEEDQGAAEEAQLALDKFLEEEWEDWEEYARFYEDMENEVPGFSYGATLIHADYWADYVKEMVKDIGDLPNNIPSYLVIDWEATADNVAADYPTLDWDGEMYYYRDC